MPIPVGQMIVYEIQLVGHATAAGGRQVPIRNVWHYARSAPLVPNPSKTHLVAEFDTIVGTPLAAAMNARWVAEYYLCRCINDATDQYAEVISTLVGGIATDSYDSRSAVYMQMVSGFRGRSFNGAKHFTPLSEADTTGDILSGAGLTRWEAVRDAMKLTLTDADGQIWRPVIFSRLFSQTQTNPTSVTTSDVIQILLNKNIGDMKRRKSGRVIA